MESALLLLLLAPIITSMPVAYFWHVRRDDDIHQLPRLAVGGLGVSLISAIYLFLFADASQITIEWLPALGINFVFVFDYLSLYMGVLTALIAFLIGIYGLEYMDRDYRTGWYWLFFNVFVSSMLLVVYSDSLFLLLVGWEGLGIASWGLIGHWFRDDDDISFVGKKEEHVGPLSMHWGPSAGGWRAISTIRFGDMPMFFAIAAIFVLAGTMTVSEIAWNPLFLSLGAAGVVTIMLLFMMGPFTKSAQLPFSEWLMTAMTGPTTVSALLHSATMVAAGTYVFIRMSWYIQPWTMHGIPGVEAVYLIILIIGLLSALYGAIVALGMRERKVLLAASTMSSLGLMFATAAASYWVGELALYVAFWYLIVHAFAKATLFLIAGDLIHTTHDRFSGSGLKAARRLKIAFGTTVFATIALVGIPPLTSYWVKSGMDVVMEELIHDLGIMPFALLIVISIAYAAALAKFMSLNFITGNGEEQAHEEGHAGHPRRGLMTIGYTAMAGMLIYILYVVIAGSDAGIGRHFLEEGLIYSSFIVGICVTAAYAFGALYPSTRALKGLSAALTHRLYLPFLNDYLVPKIGWAFAAVVDGCNVAIDHVAHTAVPRAFGTMSKNIREIQTGALAEYLKAVLGIVIALMIFASIGGWL